MQFFENALKHWVLMLRGHIDAGKKSFGQNTTLFAQSYA